MNFLKKLMIALSASLVLWSCSDDDESTNGSNATISLSTSIIQIDRNGGDATVTVTSSDDWRLSGASDWAHPSATSGKSGDVVTFTIDPNSIDEKRVATFKFFTGSAVIPLQVESDLAYVNDLLSDANPTISKDKNIVKIELNTNIADINAAYSDGGEKWVTFDKRIDFAGKTILIFKAAKNETYKTRFTTITLTNPLTQEPVKVNLSQKETEAIIFDNQTLTYDLAARSISINVKYNVQYTISIPQGKDWITDQTVSDPQIGDDGLSTITLNYKLSEAPNTRGGVIRIEKTDGSLTSDISLVQKDSNIELTLIPDNVLRAYCVSSRWIISIAGPQCVILPAAEKATALFVSVYTSQIKDLTGIENFPNLTTLILGYCENMNKLDISGLHNVTDLSFRNARQCSEYNLGDNPLKSFDAGGAYMYSYVKDLKIIGSKVETLNLSLSSWSIDNDEVESIDVSECPGLTTLNANRTNKIKTLYLKEGQVIPNLTKNDATTIIYK